MMTGKLINSDKKIYIGLFLFAFMMVLSSSYNPINFRRMHIDSSVYVTISQGIINGQLPYGDFVDNKGPLTYFLNVPGLFLGGFTGIWLTELIFLFVSVLFAYKTALFLGDKRTALLGTVFGFVVFLVFFTVYAGTEEYSLPFLMISFYLFTKNMLSQEQDFKFIELIILGVCFACAIMLRLNMFPLWAGFCMVIFTVTLARRRFLAAGKYILGFCLGILIVLVPLFLYFKINGIFDDFVDQVILAGTSRGFGGSSIKETSKNFFLIINRAFSIAPVFFGLYYMVLYYKKPVFVYYCAYTFSYFLMVLFLSFSSGEAHYNMVLVPFFIPALTVLAGFLFNAFSERKWKSVMVIGFLSLVFFEGVVNYCYDLSKLITDKSGRHIIKAGKIIDTHTNPDDKIISLGYNCYIYPFTKRQAVSKYIYQGYFISMIPGARDEFLSDVLTKKPAIIVTADLDGFEQYLEYWHKPIYEMIRNEYSPLYNENGFEFYKRNN
jgi:hypothetical protein